MFENNKNGLQIARERKELTLSELASKLEVEISTIKSWELGAEFPHPNLMRKLCKVLNVSSDQILFNESRQPLNISRLTDKQKMIIIELNKKIKEQVR